MSTAPRDDNRVPAMLATSKTDGITPVTIKINVLNNRMKVLEGNSVDPAYENSQRDDNRVPAMWGVSSDDGVTPIPIYADDDNNLLIQST